MIAQILLTFFVSICLSIFNIRRGSERENFAEGISSSDTEKKMRTVMIRPEMKCWTLGFGQFINAHHTVDEEDNDEDKDKDEDEDVVVMDRRTLLQPTLLTISVLDTAHARQQQDHLTSRVV